MNTHSHLFKAIAHTLIGVMWLQPLLSIAADLRVDASSAGKTQISQAGNGVPVVNIAKPSSNGLSHNKFTDYNVDQQGLILNNSTNKFIQTQLGGIIVGNSKLNGHPAQLILNEVTGGQASQLKGYTEVAGQQTHVVVANPHGINCDGCGFINTPRVTLSTGKPIVEQGQLKRYDVERGQIEISGAGLNASNISQFDLITRSAKINAELHANQLNIITGRNTVDAQTLAASAKTDRSADKPTLAIDSSALGGMYAGTIRLIGTEAGVGVKLAGDMAASAGDIQIDVNGRLSLARTAARGGINLKAAHIDLTQDVYSEQSTQISAKHGAINVNNSLAAAGDLYLDAALIDNHGVIESGIKNNGTGNAASTLTVQGGEFKNQGEVLAQGALGTDLNMLDNQNGHIFAVDSAQVNVDHLDNRSGHIFGKKTLNLNAQTLDNSKGTLASNQALTVQASEQINNNDGLLLSQSGELSIASQTINNQAGILQANSVEVDASALLDNREGEIIATQGDLKLSQADINNDAGKLISQQKLTVDASSLTNKNGLIGGQDVIARLTEQLNNNTGLLEATDTLLLDADSVSNNSGRLRVLGQTGSSVFTIKTLFDNDNGLIEVGSPHFLLSSKGLTNQQGTVRHLGDQFALNLHHVGQAGGGFFTNGTLYLEMDRWLNTSELQAQQIELNVNHFTNSASGVLRSFDDLHARGNTWVNDGRVETGGALHLSLTDSYQGKGALQSLGGIYVKSPKADMQQGANIRSGQHAEFELGSRFINAGTLSAVGDVLIRVADLENQGTLGAGQKLRIETEKLLNQGLIFSRADMTLRSHTLTNLYADIYSLGTLNAAKDDAYAAMTVLDNRSGNIESSGDMYLYATTLTNRKEQFRIDKNLTYGRIGVTCYDCGGDHHNVDYVATERFEFAVAEDSAAARIHASGNLALQSESFANHYSSLSASGDINIFTDTLENIAASTAIAQRVRRFNTGRITDGTDDRFRWSYIYPYNRSALSKSMPSALYSWRLVSDIETQTATGIAAPAIIQAGNDIQIQSRNTINNASIISQKKPKEVSTQTLDTHVDLTAQSLVVQLNAQLPANHTQQIVDPTTLPSFSLSQGQNKLFDFNLNSKHPYLLETNPLLTSLTGFVSSNYLLQGLGYNSDLAQRRLGDGLYEQRLIEQAVIARTGKRFLGDLTSTEDQFRYLMDNAIISKESLNLSLGVSLTAEQIAALTHDIVWLEERDIQGKKVLVPILYLAQASDRVAPNGAMIQGRNVALVADAKLKNSGVLRASSSLAVSAENITNSGLMQADQQLQLLVQDSIHNQHGGLISGRDVSLLAVTGDIVNERTITQETRSGQDFSQTSSVVDHAAGIEAANDLSILAGRDIYNNGASLAAGEAIDLNAGRNVLLVSAEENNGQMRQDKRHFWSNNSTTQHASNIQTGTQLNVRAGQDIAVVASTVKATENISLQAGQNVLVTSAANANGSEYRYSRSGKKVNQANNQVRQQSAIIEAGGNLTSVSGADTKIIASQISAGKEADFVAGGKVQLLAAQDQDYAFYEKKKKGSFGRKSLKSNEYVQITHVGSSVSSGDNLIIASGGEQRYQAATLDSGADLTLDSGAGIVFESVKDLEQKSRIRSKSSWAWQSAKGKGHTDETLIQSQLQAQGEIAIRAAEKIQIDIKEINQQSVSLAVAAIAQADPQLAWLKQMEQRGDVDWRQVKELHDSFSYSHSGLGGPAAMVVAIVVSYYIAGVASGMISSTAGATAGSGTAMAASGTATASAVANGAVLDSIVAAGWANATYSGILAGAAGGTASAVSQGQDWRSPALTGAITGGFAGYLSAGTYYNNPINTASNISKYLGSGEWMNLGKEVSQVGMNQAFGYAQSKVAKEIGLKPEELNWLLMAGSILGNQLGGVGSRFVEEEEGFSKTNGKGIRGVANRNKAILGLPFDAIDIALGYQGLPTASVQDYLSTLGTSNTSSSGHSLGVLDNIYLGSNGLTGKVYLYSVPFAAVAPPNAEVMLGSWDFVNGGWLGKLFNWDAKVVPIKPWEHSFENYKKYIKE